MNVFIQCKISSKNKLQFIAQKFILETFFKKLKIKYSIIMLPTKYKKLMLLRAPHIHKKSWKAYITSYYKSIFYFSNIKILLIFNIINFFFSSLNLKWKIVKGLIKKKCL